MNSYPSKDEEIKNIYKYKVTNFAVVTKILKKRKTLNKKWEKKVLTIRWHATFSAASRCIRNVFKFFSNKGADELLPRAIKLIKIIWNHTHT